MDETAEKLTKKSLINYGELPLKLLQARATGISSSRVV